MKNSVKLLVVFLIFFFVFISYVKASSVNMDLDYENYTTSETNSVFDSNQDDDLSNNISNSISNTSTSTSNRAPTVITTSSDDSEFLTIENILSIIIIVIGIILIFLGIAIIIRCK